MRHVSFFGHVVARIAYRVASVLVCNGTFDLTCQTAIHNACMDVTKTRSPPPTSAAGSAHPSSPVPSQFSRLENCDAVMVALSRTRYAIIYRDDAKRMVPAERICKRIRDLKAGDEVIYNGRRETVHGLCAF